MRKLWPIPVTLAVLVLAACALPLPTATPGPTAPPTLEATPEPQVHTGTGDFVLDLDPPASWGVLHITGNAGGRHFAVESYDGAGNRHNLLVDTTEPYDGYRPYGFVEGDRVQQLAIQAVGDWTVEVLPGGAALARHTEIDSRYEGFGDDVVFLVTSAATSATMTGPPGSRHFVLIAYGDGGREPLIDATEAYSGVVRLPKGTFALEVVADGRWLLTVK